MSLFDEATPLTPHESIWNNTTVVRLGETPIVRPTAPVRAPNSNATPDGRPSLPGRNDSDPANIAAFAAENKAAEDLSKLGFDVYQQPTVGNGRLTEADLRGIGLNPNSNPDLLVNQTVFDVYSPTNNNPRSIWSNIRKTKLAKGQTRRMVVNLDDSTVDIKKLLDQFTEHPMTAGFGDSVVHLEEAIFLRDGEIVGRWVK